MSIAPSDLCTDYEFVRRAYLDCIGRMPTTDGGQGVPRPTRAPKKRDQLIDALVEMPEFADFWALKWADVLRSSRKTIQVKGSYGFQAWLRDTSSSATRRWTSSCSEMHHRQRQHLHEPAGELLPHRQGPARAWPRPPRSSSSASGCSAPSATTTRSSAGRQDDYYGLAACFAQVKTKPEPVIGAKTARNDRCRPRWYSWLRSARSRSRAPASR